MAPLRFLDLVGDQRRQQRLLIVNVVQVHVAVFLLGLGPDYSLVVCAIVLIDHLLWLVLPAGSVVRLGHTVGGTVEASTLLDR